MTFLILNKFRINELIHDKGIFQREFSYLRRPKRIEVQGIITLDNKDSESDQEDISLKKIKP